MTTANAEAIVGNGLMALFGDPMFGGLAVVGLCSAAVFLVPTHPALKALAIFGGLLLAAPFLPAAALVGGIGLGVLVWMAVSRMTTR